MKKLKISLAAVLTVFLIVQTVFCLSGGIYASAEETPEVSVSAPATVAAGEEASIMVNIDCQDKVFTSGSVKVQLSADTFTGVSAAGDTDIACEVSQDAEYVTVTYFFEIAAGLYGEAHIGTIKAIVQNETEQSAIGNIDISEIKFVSNTGTDESAAFKITNAVVNIAPKSSVTATTESTASPSENVAESVTATAANTASTAVNTSNGTATSGTSASAAASDAETQTNTELPAATATQGSDAAGLAAGQTTAPSDSGESLPTVTSVTTLLADTESYTLEEIEDISAGAIVFWSIVSLVAGVWIGIGFGYMFWRKRKSKPQIKDSNRNVIGHLQ